MTSPEPYEYVVKAAPCDGRFWNSTAPCEHAMADALNLELCSGCMGDGTRLLAETKVRVEQRKQYAWSNDPDTGPPIWVPVETREEP